LRYDNNISFKKIDFLAFQKSAFSLKGSDRRRNLSDRWLLAGHQTKNPSTDWLKRSLP
jgi:hypothetical protein